MNKRGEQLEKEKARHAEDRISSLPAVLLTYILSFLSTKDSVRTSVLSTRWKRVWVYVPALDLGDWAFLPKGYDSGNCSKRRDNFLAFVSCFLTQSNIYSFRKFCLSGEEYYDQSLIESWVCAANSPNIEELLLDMSFFGPTDEEDWWSLELSYRPLDPVFQHKNSLPHIGKLCITLRATSSRPCVLESLVSRAKEWNFTVLELEYDEAPEDSFPPSSFAFEKLVVLRLHFWSNGQIPKASIRFPNLKFLYLCHVEFTDDESAANLISSCPVLEELYFDGFLESLVITSPTLKCLEVESDSDSYLIGRDIVIDAPALEFLKLQNGSFKNYVLGLSVAVVTAEVGVGTLYATFEVIRKIPNVKHLSLGCLPEVLEETDSYDHLTFDHLTRLEFHESCSWRFMIDLLKMAPYLKDLLIVGMEAVFDFTPEQDVPLCLVSNLRTIVILIGYTTREKNVVDVISYFLRNSKVLKQMYIGFSHSYREVIKQAVLAIPKGSISCQIEFGVGSRRLWEEMSDA